jgi:chromosome segregation ATPase
MDLDRRIEELERSQRRMGEEIEQLKRELRALGVQIPELDPAAPGKTPLAPEARLAAMRRAAAHARASKRVGSGSGAVSNPETLERLQGGTADDDGETDGS